MQHATNRITISFVLIYPALFRLIPWFPTFCVLRGRQHLPQGVIRHFALSVTDVDELADRIEKAGYEVFVKPKNIYIPAENPLVARIAFCYGPLGEQIELFCEK